MRMERGEVSGTFITNCDLPGKQCYSIDPALSHYGLKNDGCSVPTKELKERLKSFSDRGGPITEICLCLRDLCNAGSRVSQGSLHNYIEDLSIIG